MVGILLTALFVRFVVMWGMLVDPYKTFLTEGHRDGDFIYDKFEYDRKYDTDKFYRKAIDIQW